MKNFLEFLSVVLLLCGTLALCVSLTNERNANAKLQAENAELKSEIEDLKRDIRSFVALRATPLQPLDDSDFSLPVVTLGEEVR